VYICALLGSNEEIWLFSPALLSLMGVPATLALASFSFALLQQQPKAAYADCFFFDEGADTITI
jgi:hypothetical protein